MPRKATRRRAPREGGVYSYKTKAGERWYWKASIRQPDGTVKVTVRRGFLVKSTPRDGGPPGALDDMRTALEAAARGAYVQPSKMTVGAWLDEWAAGLRLAQSTVASYRKNIRLHVKPHIGSVPLASLTSARLTKLYRELETSGRRNGKGELTGEGLSARTVRYIHTIIGAALAAAVDAEPPLLIRNPAGKASPPTAQQAEAPEMHPWTADQLRAFLGWSREKSDLYPAWYVLAYTGMRRGELLALRWRHIDLDAGTISIQRTIGVVRNKGEGAQIVEKVPKTRRSRRVIDIDPGTVAVLRSWKKERGTLALALARDDALVFGDQEGQHRHPERFWRTFKSAQRQCAKALGDGAPPEITVHDLRHTHATLLLADREPVKTVSERLGHASITVTLTVYGHVMPGDQRRAADRFAALVGEA
jgi:integrase